MANFKTSTLEDKRSKENNKCAWDGASAPSYFSSKHVPYGADQPPIIGPPVS